MTNKTLCPICENMPHGGTLCKEHRKTLAGTLHQLRVDCYAVQKYALRQAKPNNGGGARSPYPQAAYALNWGDLLEEVRGVLWEIGSDVGLWESHDMQLLIRRIVSRMGLLASSPECGNVYCKATVIADKVHRLVEPKTDVVVYGRCLNPVCDARLVGRANAKEVSCRSCGSRWSVREINRHRAERLSGQTIICTPAAAAEWCSWKTGRRCDPHRVSMWLKRGKLPSSERREGGKWVFDTGELMALMA